MAVRTSYPVIRPSLNIDFANARVVDSRVTFTRASTATYFDRFGVLQTAPSGVPRLNHDPATGESKGLQIEEQRTNLLTYSSNFSNAAWVKYNSSVASDVAIAPDGTLTADKITEDTTTNWHLATQVVSVTSGSVYTYTCYVKAAERTKAFIGLSNVSGTLQGSAFDLTGNGSVLYWGVFSSPTSRSITYVGNGWYLCSITVTASSTAGMECRVGTFTSGTPSYTGDGVSGIYMWGAQLEAGAFPTSYIATTSAQVTRAADVPSMTGANLTNWFNGSEGTIVVESDTAKLNISSMLGLSAGSSYGAGNGFLLRVTAANNVEAGGHGAAVSTGTLAAPVSANVPFKSAAFYQGTAQGVCAKGSTVKSNTSCDFTGAGTTSLIFGALTTGGLQGIGSGHIKRMAFYPKLLSDAEYQGLTL